MANFAAAVAIIGASSGVLYLGMGLVNKLVERTLGHRGQDFSSDVAVVAPDHPSGGVWRRSRS
ncbi:MAG TPA: hypothetical protein VKM56_01950 [Verrucomicrobiae bacterium]|nr:hypothetical protein [Verrucomicrobiae bacterium]